MASTTWQVPLSQTQRLRDHSFKVARRAGAPPELADDIAQITMMRLSEACGRTPELINEVLSSETAEAYVASATRNVLAGYYRGEDRRLRREATAMESLERLNQSATEIDEQLGVILIEELASSLLTPDEQAIIHCRYFLGRTVNETAELLGLTPGQVSHKGRSANGKIRQALMAD
jgi:RNA polymerase sigma factor (sigma-70 family)